MRFDGSKKIASLRPLRALQYNQRQVRFGALIWPINSLKAGELLILIPYVTRRNAFAATACFAIHYLMDLPEYANFLAIYDS